MAEPVERLAELAVGLAELAAVERLVLAEQLVLAVRLARV